MKTDSKSIGCTMTNSRNSFGNASNFFIVSCHIFTNVPQIEFFIWLRDLIAPIFMAPVNQTGATGGPIRLSQCTKKILYTRGMPKIPKMWKKKNHPWGGNVTRQTPQRWRSRVRFATHSSHYFNALHMQS